jgi:methyl-accepting chemotaxis protein
VVSVYTLRELLLKRLRLLMKTIRNLKFRQKLLLLVTPPILGALFFAGYDLNRVLIDKSEVEQIRPIVELSIEGSLIVHELQKERGATSGYVSSKGTVFKDILATQRRSTDVVLNKTIKLIKEQSKYLKETNTETYNRLLNVTRKLEQLTQHRTRVDRLTISAADAAQFFTELNHSLLSVSGDIANLSTYGELTTKLRNYYTFMQVKESAGQERAILNIALSHGSFQVGQYQKIVTLASFQEAYLKIFEQFVSHEQLSALSSISSSRATKKVLEIRAITHKKYVEGNFGVSGEEWFKVSTDRINQLKALEDLLAEDIESLVTELGNTADNAILNSSIIAFSILMLTFLLSAYVSRLLIGQALHLAETIEKVSKNRDVSLRVDVQSTDELGSSAKSFNDMLDVFSDMLSEIEISSAQLTTAAEETSTSVVENVKNLEKQSLETTLAASATEEMTATVNEIANNIAATADSANYAASLSSEGVFEIEKNADNMSDLNEQMSSANTQVVQLRDSSKEINEIVDVIKKIADQTNLLALNAAIEAARAGEQGRGFAVVADEVRALAQRTQESTQEIEAMVIRFQAEADGVSQSIESSFAHVRESLGQTLSVKNKLSEINIAIESITDMCTQVATAAEEQVAATNEIAMNIRTINDLAELSVETGGHIAQAAQEQTELSSQQHDLVTMFKFT